MYPFQGLTEYIVNSVLTSKAKTSIDVCNAVWIDSQVNVDAGSLIYWSSKNKFKHKNSTLTTSKALYIKPISVCFSDEVCYIAIDWSAFLSL